MKTNQHKYLYLDKMPEAFELSRDLYPVLFPEFLFMFIGKPADGTDRVLVQVLVGGDQKTSDRFLVYEVSKTALKRFLNLKIGHYEFVNSAVDGMCVLYDIGDDMKPYDITMPHISNLAAEYLPAPDAEIEQHDFMNKSRLFEMFSLDGVSEEEEDVQPILLEIARMVDAPIINIHIKKGGQVGYGTIDSEVLGNILINFVGWVKAMSRKNKLLKSKGKGKNISMEVDKVESIIQKAASYSMFFKPVFVGFEDLTQIEMAKKLSETMQTFMQKSLTERDAKVLLDEDRFLTTDFGKYKNLVQFLNEVKVEMDIAFIPSWEKPETYSRFKLSDTNIRTTIDVYDRLKDTHTETIEVEGRFVALNQETKHYKLLDLKESANHYSGHFSEHLKEEMIALGFVFEYRITFDRVSISRIDSNNRFEDTITKVEKIGR